jgi:hypothetical protein
MMGLIKSFVDWQEGITDTIKGAADWCNKKVEAVMTSTLFWEK